MVLNFKRLAYILLFYFSSCCQALLEENKYPSTVCEMKETLMVSLIKIWRPDVAFSVFPKVFYWQPLASVFFKKLFGCTIKQEKLLSFSASGYSYIDVICRLFLVHNAL